MKHITLLTIGSRGDVQPFIALGRALQQEGVQVRLATHARFESLARLHHLDFAPIHSDPLAILNSDAGQAWINSGKNPFSLISNMIKLGRPVFEQLIDDATAACQNTDLIVYTVFGSVAYHLAEKQGIPSVMANLQPIFGRRADFPASGAPTWPADWPLLGPLYNRFTYRLVEQVFWQPFRPLVQRWRRDSLSLPPTPFFGPYRDLWEQQAPFLYAYSEAVVPAAPNAPAWYHTTGYWQLPPSENWEPPAELLRFLEDSNKPPIYLGFGSMADQEPQKLLDMIAQALAETGERAVVLRGWAELGAGDVPDSIHLVSSVPHSWLFQQVRAVVHHGGAGTTASGLTAGKPSLVVPFFADQHFWGDRVYRLGAGPRPVPRNRLTATKLAQAIHEMTHNQTMIETAGQLGEQLRQKNGAKRAAQILTQMLG